MVNITQFLDDKSRRYYLISTDAPFESWDRNLPVLSYQSFNGIIEVWQNYILF